MQRKQYIAQQSKLATGTITPSRNEGSEPLKTNYTERKATGRPSEMQAVTNKTNIDTEPQET